MRASPGVLADGAWGLVQQGGDFGESEGFHASRFAFAFVWQFSPFAFLIVLAFFCFVCTIQLMEATLLPDRASGDQG